MTIDEVKAEIEQRTGVPAQFIQGETVEEAIAHSKALLAYKRENAEQVPVDSREAFESWFKAINGIQEATPEQLLDNFAEELRTEAGGYPQVHDAGEVSMGDPRSAEDKFAEWFYQRSAFDPFAGSDGWKHLL